MRETFLLIGESRSLVGESFCFVRESRNLMREAFCLVRESRNLMREACLLIRESRSPMRGTCWPSGDSWRLVHESLFLPGEFQSLIRPGFARSVAVVSSLPRRFWSALRQFNAADQPGRSASRVALFQGGDGRRMWWP